MIAVETEIDTMRRGEKPLADFDGGFSLGEREGKHSDGWMSFVVRRRARRGIVPKRSWYLGHNGERLARRSDAGFLFEHHPEIYAEVDRFLKAWVPAQRLLVD